MFFSHKNGRECVCLFLQERKADVLRFSGLPKSDHSVFVEELGTFAPTGSYAHDRQGGLGGDKEASEIELSQLGLSVG